MQQAPTAKNHATPNVYSGELEKLCTRGDYCICDLRESLGHCLLEFSTFPNANSQGSSLLAQVTSRPRTVNKVEMPLFIFLSTGNNKADWGSGIRSPRLSLPSLGFPGVFRHRHGRVLWRPGFLAGFAPPPRLSTPAAECATVPQRWEKQNTWVMRRFL